MKTLSAGGAAIHPALTLRALVLSDLYWGMSVAQQTAALYSALSVPVEVKSVTSEDAYAGLKLEVSPQVHTMWGLPVTLDETLPPGIIELRRGVEVLARIEHLAIPVGM